MKGVQRGGAGGGAGGDVAGVEVEVVGRRDFFKSLKGVLFASGGGKQIRPPYNIEKEKFIKCIRCEGYCAKACEERIIVINKYGIPYIDARLGHCTFCKECVRACSYGVLEEGGASRIEVGVKINEGLCLSWQEGEGCTECGKACDEKAILFYGGYKGRIDTSACTGCLRCIKACEYEAIEIEL